VGSRLQDSKPAFDEVGLPTADEFDVEHLPVVGASVLRLDAAQERLVAGVMSVHRQVARWLVQAGAFALIALLFLIVASRGQIFAGKLL
jgi:hypothetical protein